MDVLEVTETKRGSSGEACTDGGRIVRRGIAYCTEPLGHERMRKLLRERKRPSYTKDELVTVRRERGDCDRCSEGCERRALLKHQLDVRRAVTVAVAPTAYTPGEKTTGPPKALATLIAFAIGRESSGPQQNAVALTLVLAAVARVSVVGLV